uniref:Uncharacterized protein n=1 Tax=Neovison vison TaxID=452646 RepID=A0A8C7AHH6_NEOVI
MFLQSRFNTASLVLFHRILCSTSPKTKRAKASILIEPTLCTLDRKMKEVEREPPEGKKQAESLQPPTSSRIWLHRGQSGYIDTLFQKQKPIRCELHKCCPEGGSADSSPSAKWRTCDHEHMSCLWCRQVMGCQTQKQRHVLHSQSGQEGGRIVECVLCGCMNGQTKCGG